MDLSGEYATRAVGHEGSSSAAQCCSLIRLVALPGEGVVISVQANTAPTDSPYDIYNSELVRLTQVLRETARGMSGSSRNRPGSRPSNGAGPLPSLRQGPERHLQSRRLRLRHDGLASPQQGGGTNTDPHS